MINHSNSCLFRIALIFRETFVTYADLTSHGSSSSRTHTYIFINFSTSNQVVVILQYCTLAFARHLMCCLQACLDTNCDENPL